MTILTDYQLVFLGVILGFILAWIWDFWTQIKEGSR